MRTLPLFKFGNFLFAVAMVFPSAAHGQAPDEQLKQLRQEYAMRFLEPEPHMALAKYFLDRGQRLPAFYILEEARRSYIEEKIFDRAFLKAFEGFDYGPEAEAALLKALADNPPSDKVNFDLGDLYIARSDWKKAKPYLLAAIKLNPNNYKYVAGLAGVLQLEGNTREAERLVKDFRDRHPDTEESWVARIGVLIEKEPVRAQTLANEARAKFPKSAELAFILANILHKRGKLDEAEKVFVEAAQLAPDSANIQAWTGRFFYKVRVNKPKALEYYLNAYFLDPHAYETEHAESRINNIQEEFAEAEIAKQMKAGVSLEKLVADPNPAVVRKALEHMSEAWRADYLEAALRCLDYDSAGVRWLATEAIKLHVDRSFDAGLKSLLSDEDLRKRGLALYLALHLWKQESFEIVRPMLAADSELLRYDAISALILEGGERGRRIALERLATEKHPTLRLLLERARQETPKP